jgi:hypothetical protein
MNAAGGLRGHNTMTGAPAWTTIQQQQQQQAAVLLAAGSISCSSGSQQLHAQAELQHHMLLLQLHEQQQHVVGGGAPGMPAGGLSVHNPAPALQHMHAPAVLSMQQQQLDNSWVLQQPTSSALYRADSGGTQQQAQQLFQQQLLAQGSPQLTTQLSAASYGSPLPDAYTDVQGMNAVLSSDTSTGMHGMHGGMNGTHLSSLSTGMNAVGLESLLQPAQVLPAVPAPPTSDALLLQLLTQQQQHQQQQYDLQGQMHASLGVSSPGLTAAVGPIPTCMGLAMQQQQQQHQQMLLQLQQQPGASGLLVGGMQGGAQ